MAQHTSPQANIKDWAQLIRVPNTFTAAADPLAGMCIGGAGLSFLSHPLPALLAALGSILLYWGGMVLNDVFDFAEDQKNQRSGPLVRGSIGIGQAKLVGSSMLGIGCILACSAAYWIHGSTAWTAVLSLLLVGAIIGYDGPLKTTPLAPLLMGLCRALNLGIGMAIASGPLFPKLPSYAWLFALAYTLYVMGFTIAARKEFLTEQSRPRLWAGWLICLAGVVLYAWTIWKYPSPSLIGLQERQGQWSQWFFPGMMLLLSVPVLRRALRSIQTLKGPDLGQAIRTAIVNILFINATLALIYAGPWAGLLVALLLLPTVLLARFFRST